MPESKNAPNNPSLKNPFLLGRLKTIKGSAARPQASDNRTVAIFCTDTGNFEAVERNDTISKVFPKAKELYRSWWRNQRGFKGGELQTTQVMSDTELVHLISCVEVGDEDEKETFFDLNFTKGVFEKLGKHCAMNKTNVHINKCGTPKEWETISEIIADSLLKRGVHVFVYEAE